MEIRRQFARLVATALAALLLAASCTATAWEPSAPDAAVQSLLAGLQAGDLSTVPINHQPEGNPQLQLDEVFGQLREFGDPEITTTGTTEVIVPASENLRTLDDRGSYALTTLPIIWSWDVGGAQPWQYTTEANLRLVEDEAENQSWVVEWNPNVLLPDLAPGEVVEVTQDRSQHRADILDADGQPLVTNRGVWRIGIDKATVDGQDSQSADELAAAARALAQAVTAGGYTFDPDAYADRVAAAGPRAFVELITLRQDGTAQVFVDGQGYPEAFTQLDNMGIHLRDVMGAHQAISVIAASRPLAPTAQFARPILGTTGLATAELIENSNGRIREHDITGLSGIAKRFDAQLAGSPGVSVQAVAPNGSSRVLFSEPATDGTPVQTTFDTELQLKAEELLANIPGASAIVAIRPSTQEVLVAASGGSTADTAMLGRFAPGSTFKVVDALAFDRAGARAETIVDCSPDIVVDGYTFVNVPGYPADALGEVPLRTAFAHSCNTAMIRLGESVPQADLLAAATDLGFEVYTPIGTPAFYGSVPASASATEHAANLIGQGDVLASPFTMARVAASITAGQRVDPRIVRLPAGEALGTVSGTVTSDDDGTDLDDDGTDQDMGNEAQAVGSDVPASALTPDEAARIRDLMAGVVHEGSANMLADIPGIVGAKTGTAQAGDGQTLHAWMIAIVDGPDEADDDLAVAVFVEDGERGSTTAGPIMREFLLAATAATSEVVEQDAQPQLASFKAGVMELGDGTAVVTPLIFEPIRENGDKIRFAVPASDAPEPAIYVGDFVEVWWDVAGGVRGSYPPQITVTEWRRITLDDLTDEELAQMPREAEASPHSLQLDPE